jgi:hypothetical protein
MGAGGVRGVRVILVPSPFVGRQAWRATAKAMAATSGWRVEIADSSPNRVEPPIYANLSRRIAAASLAAGDWRTVVVGHSGAGGLLPSIVDALVAEAQPVGAAILADAILPHPGRSWFDTAPDDLVQRLRPMIRDGRLPSWDQWFGPGALARLLPDEDLRSAFIADIEPVSAAYCETPAPQHLAWPPPRVGYLRLSEAYAGETASAETAGWLVRRVMSHHLAMVNQPARVAESLRSMVNALVAAD